MLRISLTLYFKGITVRAIDVLPPWEFKDSSETTAVSRGEGIPLWEMMIFWRNVTGILVEKEKALVEKI